MSTSNNNRKFKMNKKFNRLNFSANNKQAYLQSRLDLLIPSLISKIIQKEDGQYLFFHPTFPDLQVEGMTFSFVQEHLERAIKRHFKGQSNKHIDYLCELLTA
jgi:hypothetical protein